MKRKLRILFLVLVAGLVELSVSAQCAMCRATAESASTNVDPGIGEGLNSAIVYMMAAPYLLLGTVCVVFWRKKIQTFIKS
jgi:hypothetical protein